jgi:hypothetical protein
MATFKNVSGGHLHVKEHTFVAPGALVDLPEEDARKLVGGGWLMPIIDDIASQIIDGEISNFVNHISGQPESPIDVTVPVIPGASVEDKKTEEPVKPKAATTKAKPSQNYIQEAIEKAKQDKLEKEKAAKAKQQIFDSTQYDDTLSFVPPTVGSNEYGNIEISAPSEPQVFMDGGLYTTESPSAKLDEMVDKIVEAATTPTKPPTKPVKKD